MITRLHQVKYIDISWLPGFGRVPYYTLTLCIIKVCEELVAEVSLTIVMSRRRSHSQTCAPHEKTVSILRKYFRILQ